jgi:hypothetical protein
MRLVKNGHAVSAAHQAIVISRMPVNDRSQKSADNAENQYKRGTHEMFARDGLYEKGKAELLYTDKAASQAILATSPAPPRHQQPHRSQRR